jgi:acyl-CoA thioester hydrolase
MSQEKFVAAARFNVRYAETDAMGIVHHASYIVWFEEGRSHYMRARGSSYADFERSGFYIAVTDVSARYLKAAVYDNPILVRCWLSEVRSRTMAFEYEVLHEHTGDLFVTGITRHICLDKEGRIARVPAQWASWLKSEG